MKFSMTDFLKTFWARVDERDRQTNGYDFLDALPEQHIFGAATTRVEPWIDQEWDNSDIEWTFDVDGWMRELNEDGDPKREFLWNDRGEVLAREENVVYVRFKRK